MRAAAQPPVAAQLALDWDAPAVPPAPAPVPALVPAPRPYLHRHDADFAAWQVYLDGEPVADVWAAGVDGYFTGGGWVQPDRGPVRRGRVEIVRALP